MVFIFLERVIKGPLKRAYRLHRRSTACIYMALLTRKRCLDLLDRAITEGVWFKIAAEAYWS
jgi:hypothetical protein